MSDQDWLNADRLEKTIDTRSQERRADPLSCLAEFLKEFWTEDTEEDVKLLWQHRAGTAPWFAEDMLYCLDAVIANPPPELEKFLREQGGVYLYHDDDEATLYNDVEALAWLKKVAKEFRNIYEAGKAAEVEQ